MREIMIPKMKEIMGVDNFNELLRDLNLSSEDDIINTTIFLCEGRREDINKFFQYPLKCEEVKNSSWRRVSYCYTFLINIIKDRTTPFYTYVPEKGESITTIQALRKTGILDSHLSPLITSFILVEVEEEVSIFSLLMWKKKFKFTLRKVFILVGKAFILV